MSRPYWSQEQIVTGSKMWRSGDEVPKISKVIGKSPTAIYGYARDNRELFPKRTRGARKKKVDKDDIPALTPIPLSEMNIKSSRSAKALKQSIMINERLAKQAEKMQQPKAAEAYRRAAALNRRELQIIEERDNG